MSDPYLEIIQTYWEAISQGYNEYAEERPVMLLEIQTGDLHAFPPAEFKQLLDPQSQRDFQIQYRARRHHAPDGALRARYGTQPIFVVHVEIGRGW